MNALFENFKNDCALVSNEEIGNSHLKKYYLCKNMNNDNGNTKENFYQMNISNNERIIKLTQTMKELNTQYLKERKYTLMNTNKNNMSSLMKNIKRQELKENYIKNTVDSFSEVKKFKTELCHSWELTGTCKYGLNVIYKIYNIYFNL